MKIPKYWKTIVLVLIILGFIFYYEVLPRYNLKIAQIGYNQGLIDGENNIWGNVCNNDVWNIEFENQSYQLNLNQVCELRKQG